MHVKRAATVTAGWLWLLVSCLYLDRSCRDDPRTGGGSGARSVAAHAASPGLGATGGGGLRLDRPEVDRDGDLDWTEVDGDPGYWGSSPIRSTNTGLLLLLS